MKPNKNNRKFMGCVFAVLLAIGALPLMGEVVGRMLGHWEGLIAPSLIIPCALAIFYPKLRLIIITMIFMYLGEWLALLAGQRNAQHSIARQIINQPWPWAALPACGLLLASITATIVKKLGGFRWPLKNYYAITLSRPDLLFRKYWPAATLLLIGATLDTITTINSMLAYGTEGELHPAMQLLSEEFGIVLGVSVGTCVRLAFVLFVAAAWRKWTGTIMFICGVLYCLAAASNHFLWL